MLSPDEFTAGSVANAPVGSLVLPRRKNDAAMLIGAIDGASIAVFLGEQFKFNYFPTAEATNWSGLIVPNVRIEVDEKTAFELGYRRMLGAAVRQDDGLGIYATTDGPRRQSLVVPFTTGLKAKAKDPVGFTKWQVVLGAAHEKRVLFEVQLPTAKSE